MQTQFGGSVSTGPALLSLNGFDSATAETANPPAAAEQAPPTTVAEQPAMDAADNTSPQSMPPLWALSLSQSAKPSDALGIAHGAIFEETFALKMAALKMAGGAEVAPPLETVSPISEPVSTDASVTLPLQTPSWANSLSQ